MTSLYPYCDAQIIDGGPNRLFLVGVFPKCVFNPDGELLFYTKMETNWGPIDRCFLFWDVLAVLEDKESYLKYVVRRDPSHNNNYGYSRDVDKEAYELFKCGRIEGMIDP